MKWILIIAAFQTSAGGAHIDHIPFDSRDLCQIAEKTLAENNAKGAGRRASSITTACVQQSE